jgi:superfamily II DNA or RNA helicase
MNVVRAVPGEGQVVLVRGEYWAVTEVKSQGLPRSSADEDNQLQHLVSLSSLAGEKLGHEIRVLWELEVGASVLPDLGLPEVADGKFDDPQQFAAFLDSMRWGAVTSADMRTLQAPFRSGAKVEAYQLEPVRRALAGARANMLLADDVGLGKTIEAGLVVQELLLRHRARTVCVVAPASLAVKWQEEMRDKFGLEFVIVNSDGLKLMRRDHGLHVNPFSFHPRVIISMQWLPGERAQRMLSEIYDKVDADESGQSRAFDILIVDEAHHVAPASPHSVSPGKRGYAVDTLRTIAVRELAQRCENRLFLTATPHNGYTESFTALLEMVDSRRFARGAIVDKEALAEVVVRRLKKNLTAAGVRNFPKRKVIALQFTPSAEELNAYEKLETFLQKRKKDLKKAKVNDLSTLLLKKRFLSSPVAFAYTLETYMDSRGGSIDDLSDYDDVLGENSDDMEEGLFDQEEFSALRSAAPVGADLSKQDYEELKSLALWGRDYTGRPDSRLQVLVDFLNETTREKNGEFNNERVVIFSEYVDTVNWIKSILQQRGYDEDRLAVIIGSTDPEEREEIKARFQADPSEQPLRILLATDAAGEGIDLQNYCHRLVNFDIPFNPNRLEQRAGRIDRWGQEDEPEIYHFGADQKASVGFAGDVEMLARVLRRIVQQEDDLGSVNQVISEEIQLKLTGTKGTSKKVLKIDDLTIAKMMHGEREVRDELTKLEDQLEETLSRLHVRPENLLRVVDAALLLDHQPPLVGKTDKKSKSTVYEVPKLALGWSGSIQSLTTRLDRDTQRHITFDPSVAEGRQDLVLVHLGHPLVQHSARILRAALWRKDSALRRVTAVAIPGLKEPVVAALSRLVLVGKGGVRLHEEVFLAGIRVKGKALGEDASETLLEEYLDGKNLHSLSLKEQTEIAKQWNAGGAKGALPDRLRETIALRKKKRLDEVKVLLTTREQEDVSRVSEIFDRFDDLLKQSLKQAADDADFAEGQLFDEQKVQRAKDIAKWSQRREMLAEERNRELEKVQRRYQEVEPYEFSAALVFAYPGEANK